MDIFNIVRYAFVGFLLVITIITLGLSASLISFYTSGAVVPVFLALNIAVAVITLVAVVPCVVIDFFRKGAFTSMVAIEIAWSFVLMILWVAGAGQTTSQLQLLPKSCNFVAINADGVVGDDTEATSLCRQALALEGMTWLGFIALLAWLVALITFAAIAHSRGNPSVWKKSVTGTNFLEHVARTENQQYPPSQPMQQQYTGYPQPQYSPQPVVQPQPASYPPTAQYPAGHSPSPGVAQV